MNASSTRPVLRVADHQISLRVNRGEWEGWADAAAEQGITTSIWLRRTAQTALDPTRLCLELPPELQTRLEREAARSCRSLEQEVLYLLHGAIGREPRGAK